MQEKEQQITAIFWFWLQARRRVQDTALQMRPPIQYLLILQKQLLALPIHSYINTSAENYTPVMLRVCLAEELLAS